ncbi:hypothetical protein OSTOST_04567 [Ostertagia ostertagi]
MLMTTMNTAMVNMVLATTGTNTITPMAMASRKASMRVDTVTTAATSTVDGEVMQKERNTDHITTTMNTAMVNMVLATTGTNTITPMAMASRKASMRVDMETTAATSTVDGEVMQKERNTDHITDLHTMTATVKDTTVRSIMQADMSTTMETTATIMTMIMTTRTTTDITVTITIITATASMDTVMTWATMVIITAMTTTELPNTLRTRFFASCTKDTNKLPSSIFF